MLIDALPPGTDIHDLVSELPVRNLKDFFKWAIWGLFRLKKPDREQARRELCYQLPLLADILVHDVDPVQDPQSALRGTHFQPPVEDKTVPGIIFVNDPDPALIGERDTLSKWHRRADVMNVQRENLHPGLMRLFMLFEQYGHAHHYLRRYLNVDDPRQLAVLPPGKIAEATQLYAADRKKERTQERFGITLNDTRRFKDLKVLGNAFPALQFSIDAMGLETIAQFRDYVSEEFLGHESEKYAQVFAIMWLVKLGYV